MIRAAVVGVLTFVFVWIGQAHPGFFTDFDNPRSARVGPRKYAGRPFSVPGIPMAITSAASLGEHNDGILHEVAALSAAEIESLAAEGVIATAPRPEEPRP